MTPTDNFRALLIGIDAYDASPLKGCVNDIDAVESLLLDRLKVSPDRIVRLAAPRSDQQPRTRLPAALPTYDNIRQALMDLGGERVQEGDRVFIYYSGHGVQCSAFQGETRVFREALVPCDFVPASMKPLLVDAEINGLLGQIALRTSDVTVLLDCCHSAGATRSILEEDGAVRSLRMGERGLPEVQLSAVELAPVSPGHIPPHVVLTACQADESAREVDNTPGSGVRGGLLTMALMQILADVPDEQLTELRFADIWPRLLASVTARNPAQRPLLIGQPERHLFGGPYTPGDPGLLVTATDLQYAIAAGTIMGLSVGAEVAVYGATPERFPPLGSHEDLAARKGVLRVTAADRDNCFAEPVGPRFPLPEGARGRLVLPGEVDRLQVWIDPYDTQLVKDINSSPFLQVTPLEATTGEVCVAETKEGGWLIGDEVFGHREEDELVPLGRVRPGDRDGLLRGLMHYSRYSAPMRMARRCTDLVQELQVTLLDCSDRARLLAADPHNPDLAEVAPGGGFRHAVVEDQPFCVRVTNQSAVSLFATLLNCTVSGRVEYLGYTQVPSGSQQIFWEGGMMRAPFACSLPDPRRRVGVNHFVVIATTVKGIDLRWMELDERIQESIDFASKETRDGRRLRAWWAGKIVPLYIRR